MRFILTFIFLFLIYPALGYGEYHHDQSKKLFFITPINGAIVTSPVTIKFGIKGMKVVPAGIDEPMSGHHHLLINLDKLPDMKMPIPADKNHLHFGKGQTEVSINLPKGKHTLQLLFGNYLHIPHEKPLFSRRVNIFVE
tara:strand:- start:25673 stop:26089 length:417 start_codon:yes stop_codon:yes gene_type:complete